VNAGCDVFNRKPIIKPSYAFRQHQAFSAP
jgi:hypothetical protein